MTQRLMSERRMDAAELALSGRRLDELELSVLPVVLPGARSAPGTSRMPIFVTISTEGLDAGKKGRKKARLDIHAYALDTAGEVRAGFARELKLRLEGERQIVVADEISLPGGAHQLRLLAWDLRGGRRHLSTIRVVVPTGDPAGPSLRGPFFLGAGTSRRQFAPAAVGPEDALGLFELDGELPALDPAPAIGRERSRRFLLLAPGLTESAAPELRLLAADGSAVERTIALDRLEAGADGTARFAGLLETRGLAAGRYRLEARLGGEVSAAELTVVEPD